MSTPLPLLTSAFNWLFASDVMLLYLIEQVRLAGNGAALTEFQEIKCAILSN